MYGSGTGREWAIFHLVEQELGREIDIMLNPTEEKVSKAKDILAEVKAQETKKSS